MSNDTSAIEKVFANSDRLEKKFDLIKELAVYTADHYQMFDDAKANKILKFFKDEILEECCDACGGAMCMEQCPVNQYFLAIKKELDNNEKKE